MITFAREKHELKLDENENIKIVSICIFVGRLWPSLSQKL